MKTGFKRAFLIALCALAVGLLVIFLKRPEEPAIVCRLISAEILPSNAERRAIKARLRLQLMSAGWRITCYPYAYNAFEIRPVKEHAIMVIPRPEFRPPPTRGRERQAVTLSKTPTIVDVELSENWVLVMPNELEKGAMIEFYVRYWSRSHTSNYVLVRSPLQ